MIALVIKKHNVVQIKHSTMKNMTLIICLFWLWKKKKTFQDNNRHLYLKRGSRLQPYWNVRSSKNTS